MLEDLGVEIDQTYSKFKMAKDRESHSKKRPKDDSSSDSDSGPDDRNPPPSKKDKSKDKSGPPMEKGEPTWELGLNEKGNFRDLKGKAYIDIRECYVDKKDMETKPGKKGISLNTIQFRCSKDDSSSDSDSAPDDKTLLFQRIIN